MKQDQFKIGEFTDPVLFYSMIVSKSLTDKLSMISVIEKHIKKIAPIEIAKKICDEMVDDLINNYMKPRISNADLSTRETMSGTRYVGVDWDHVVEIVRLWDTEFKHAVANGIRTCEQSYESISNIIGMEKITRHGVKRIILKHQKRDDCVERKLLTLFEIFED